MSAEIESVAEGAESRRRRIDLLSWLKTAGYSFVTPSPATHRIVLGRPPPEEPSLQDILGWNRPFALDAIPATWRDRLREADVIGRHRQGWIARARVSSLGRDLFLHSSFPPDQEDAVFFGPDTYRFARFLRAELQHGPEVDTAVDLGAGSGAGAVAAARAARIGRLILLDVSPKALETAAVNLEAAGLAAERRCGDGVRPLSESVDLIIANPPFIAGDGGRIYRDGGDMHGAEVSLDWAIEGARRLTVRGRMLLYTGSAIVRGEDALLKALTRRLDPARFELRYEEIDPDIFGGQLRSPDYADVERIAAIGAVITRRT